MEAACNLWIVGMRQWFPSRPSHASSTACSACCNGAPRCIQSV